MEPYNRADTTDQFLLSVSWPKNRSAEEEVVVDCRVSEMRECVHTTLARSTFAVTPAELGNHISRPLDLHLYQVHITGHGTAYGVSYHTSRAKRCHLLLAPLYAKGSVWFLINESSYRPTLALTICRRLVFAGT